MDAAKNAAANITPFREMQSPGSHLPFPVLYQFSLSRSSQPFYDKQSYGSKKQVQVRL